MEIQKTVIFLYSSNNLCYDSKCLRSTTELTTLVEQSRMFQEIGFLAMNKEIRRSAVMECETMVIEEKDHVRDLVIDESVQVRIMTTHSTALLL